MNMLVHITPERGTYLTETPQPSVLQSCVRMLRVYEEGSLLLGWRENIYNHRPVEMENLPYRISGPCYTYIHGAYTRLHNV